MNGEHRTYNPPDVGGYVASPITITRTNTSTAPTSDTIAFGGPETWAHPTAGPFPCAGDDRYDGPDLRVLRSVRRPGGIDHSFHPTQTGTADIGLEASAFDQWRYTNGGASLLDLTTGTQLWDYAWAYRNGPSSMPWTLQWFDSLRSIHDSDGTHCRARVCAQPPRAQQPAQDSQGASIAIAGLRLPLSRRPLPFC